MKTSPSAQAVVFEAPGKLSVQSVAIADATADDVEIDIVATGISTGTERLLWDGEMPNFPGMGYPLIPGYEAIGKIKAVGSNCAREVGELVFVGGAQCFPEVRSLFGSAASRLVVPQQKALPIDETLGNEGLLLALAATAHHALHTDTKRPAVPDVIIGHGVLGRLMARLCLALDYPAPVVWEINPARTDHAEGYSVVHPDDDSEASYQCIVDVSGDSNILDTAIQKLGRRASGTPAPQVLLAGFYKKPLSFNFAPAFMREVQIQVAAEWQPEDMQAVNKLVADKRLSLANLITHTQSVDQAASAYDTAFRDEQCLKMVLDWRNT